MHCARTFRQMNQQNLMRKMISRMKSFRRCRGLRHRRLFRPLRLLLRLSFRHIKVNPPMAAKAFSREPEPSGSIAPAARTYQLPGTDLLEEAEEFSVRSIGQEGSTRCRNAREKPLVNSA